MLRAASLPGQQLSRQAVRIRSLQCRHSVWKCAQLHTYDQSSSEQILHRATPPHLDTHTPPDNSEEYLFLPLKQLNNRDDGLILGHPPDGRSIPETPASSTTDWEHYFGSPTSQFSTTPAPSEVHPNPETLFKHLDVIHTTHDVMEAWNAYEALFPYLSDASHFAGNEKALYLCLHRLARLLSAVDPRTRTVRLRIISVVYTLRNVGARVHAWQHQLLQLFAKDNSMRPSDIKEAIGTIGDTLLFQDSRNHFDVSQDAQDDTVQNEIAKLFQDPLSADNDADRLGIPILVPPVSRLFIRGSERARVLNVLGTTQAFPEAWDAYRTFATLPPEPHLDLNKFPKKHLHRLVSLLATVKPRTRKIYLCLVSILSTMRGQGYRIRLWEWNLLVDCSAKGLRKMRPEDYKTALRVFNDMLNYQTEMRKAHELASLEKVAETDMEHRVNDRNLTLIDDYNPDIYTYTTLIAHAARTSYPPTLQHARSLLNQSNLSPNRITLLSQMRFYTMRNQMFGVRYIVAEMRERGFYLHNDGMNSLLWAFARNKHMDIAEAIYRLLRHNVTPEESDPGPEGIEATARFLDETENIVVPPKMVPDRLAYTILIQCYAYQGDLTRTLQIFMDMLSSPDPIAIWRGETGTQARFVPVLPVYRAIFLGFYRHAVDPRYHGAAPPTRSPIANTLWNIENLYAIYKSFLQLPMDQQPGDRVIYWLIMAFAKSSGYDTARLRKVWRRLEQRFGKDWGCRLQRIRKSIYGNTEHTKAGYVEDQEEDTDDDEDGDEEFISSP